MVRSGEPSADVESLRRTFETLRDPSRTRGVASADGCGGNKILRSLASEAVASIGAVAGGIFVLDEGGANLELVIPVQYPEPLADRYRLIPLAANVPVVDTVKMSAPMFLESLADYVARYPDFARAHPEIARNAFVSLPLALDGRCVGALVLGFGAARIFTPGERASLIALGDRCADELERLHRLEANSASRRRAELASLRLERLHAFTGTLAQAITPAQVVDGVIDMGLAATSAQSTALWLSSPDGASLVLSRRVGSGGPGSEEIDRLPLDAPPRVAVVDAVRDGVAVWIESRRQLDERYPEMLGRPPGGTSFACLPLVARGRRVGALVYGFEDTHRFLEDERAFLQVIAWYSAQALERASLYQEARDADRLKDEFLAMLSHELRNPLAPMVTALDLMDLTGDAHFAAERAMISRHVRHLVKLLDDLLDVARTTRGKIQLVPERCELASIVAAAVEVASPLVAQRAQRLAVSVPERGLEVIADQARLTQAIANLVTNAAKYTAPGGAITVTATADDSDVTMRVQDSGIGIAPELLPRIFDLFVQGASALDRAQGGLGIGLSVAKSVVTLHGGTLSAHSAGLGQGSEFVVRLPRARADVAAPVAASPGGARSPADRRCRVLAVDDNHDAAEMLGHALSVLGCSAVVVHDGDAALASAAAFKPQVVLLDVGLPGIDGYEVARRLRQTSRDPSLRIIAVTGYGQPSDRATITRRRLRRPHRQTDEPRRPAAPPR